MGEQPDPKTSPDDQKGLSGYSKSIRKAGPVLGAVYQLLASVILMFFLGRWLDGKFDTAPWLMIAGIIFGVGAGMLNMIRLAIQSEKNNTDSGE